MADRRGVAGRGGGRQRRRLGHLHPCPGSHPILVQQLDLELHRLAAGWRGQDRRLDVWRLPQQVVRHAAQSQAAAGPFVCPIQRIGQAVAVAVNPRRLPHTGCSLGHREAAPQVVVAGQRVEEGI